MPTAEELLRSENTQEAPVITIDLQSRLVTIPKEISILGVESDDDVNRLRFKVPRYYGEVDLSEFEININYRNAKKNPDLYMVMDKQLTYEEITFSWLVGRFATQYKGDVQFNVCFKKYAEDGVTVDLELNTTPISIPVLEGLETSEAIVEAYPDFVGEILNRIEILEQYGGTGGGSGTSAIISEVKLLSKNWVGSNNLYSQVVTIAGVTKNSQVDLTPSVEQLVVFHEKDLTFVTENDGGVVTVYAIGQKPENDYTIQVTITEVIV